MTGQCGRHGDNWRIVEVDELLLDIRHMMEGQVWFVTKRSWNGPERNCVE